MRIKFCFPMLALCSVLASLSAPQESPLLQAARKEGKVVWYTSLAIPSSTAIAHAFRTRYTGIEVEVHRTGSTPFYSG